MCAQPDIADPSVPAAPDEAEPADVDRCEPLSSHEVIVDGVTLNSNTTLKVIRTACDSLGLSKTGGKAKCLSRLHNFLSTQELVAQHAASTALTSATERAAVTLRVPEQPSEEDRRAHSLTHQPYKARCEYSCSSRCAPCSTCKGWIEHCVFRLWLCYEAGRRTKQIDHTVHS